MDTNTYLEWLHRDKLRELAPAIVILALLMIVGLVGNMSIFLFYWRQPRRSSTTFFIMVLAVTDFLVSCVMALEITDVVNTYVFKNDVACKLYIYLSHIAAITSGLLLVIIAIDRYRKLCHPLIKQLTLKHAKIICAVCLAVSLVVSFPVFLLYETSPVNITNTYNTSFSINGSDCTTTPENEKFKEIIHYVFLSGFSVCTLILIVLYTLIGRVIYRYHKNHQHFKRDLRQANAQDQISTSSGGRTSENVQNAQGTMSIPDTNRQSEETNASNRTLEKDTDCLEDPGDTDSKHIYFSSSSKTPVAIGSQDRVSTSSSNNSSDTLTNSGTSADQKASGKKAANKKYRKTMAAIKVTIMLFTITVFFIVSFVPYQIVSSLDHGVYKVTVGFELALRSFLLNSVVNPFIFGLFNADYRRSFSNVVRSIWQKISNCLTCKIKSETATLPEVHKFDVI